MNSPPNVAHAVSALVLLALSPSTLDADDWPQWMGPKRDNIWREDGIIERFPEGGPKVLGSRIQPDRAVRPPFTTGRSTTLGAHGRLVCFHAETGNGAECICVDLGKPGD